MLKRAFRLVIPVVLTGVGILGAASPTAIATGEKKPRPTSVILDPVVRDCLNHGGITRAFSLGDLRATLRHMPRNVAKYTFCPGDVESAIAALSGPAGKNTSAAILADCLHSKSGALTHRYELAVLRRARHSLPADLATYNCRHAIADQINTLR